MALERFRILFVGEVHSSHAISWIGALDNEPVNVRAFSLAPYPLPDDFAVPTYVFLASMFAVMRSARCPGA